MIKNELAFDVRSLNIVIKEIKILINKSSTFEEGKKKLLLLHSNLYCSQMSGKKGPTFEDQLWDNLTDTIARTAVNEKGRTILYGLWHSTRIEDITMNMLVNRREQIYKKQNFKKSINAGIDHTGNSLSKADILVMSSQINIKELRNYRLTVGRESQKTIQSLPFADLKKKVLKEDIERVRAEGAVDDVPSANWLLDFWGNKNVEGILFMPASRHQIVHFSENFRVKARGLTSAG
jgi:hypothetical protein